MHGNTKLINKLMGSAMAKDVLKYRKISKMWSKPHGIWGKSLAYQCFRNLWKHFRAEFRPEYSANMSTCTCVYLHGEKWRWTILGKFLSVFASLNTAQQEYHVESTWKQRWFNITLLNQGCFNVDSSCMPIGVAVFFFIFGQCNKDPLPNKQKKILKSSDAK